MAAMQAETQMVVTRLRSPETVIAINAEIAAIKLNHISAEMGCCMVA